MAFKDTGKTPVEPEVAIHRIRITLTSRNVKSLEKGQCGEFGGFGACSERGRLSGGQRPLSKDRVKSGLHSGYAVLAVRRELLC